MHNQHHLQPFGSSNSAHSSPMKRAQAVSPLASPMESRRLFAASSSSAASASSSSDHPLPHPSMALQLGYTFAGPAQPARLLVDPQTGQQFFVPTAPAPPPAYFHQPLFYNQPPPPAAAYYPPPHTAPAQPHPGFLFAHQHPPPVPTTLWAPTTLSPRHAGGPSPPPPLTTVAAPHQRQHSSSVYRVELPPSSVGSVCEEDGGGGGRAAAEQYAQHNQFQRQQRTRLSTESRSSGTNTAAGYHPLQQHQQQQPELYSNPEVIDAPPASFSASHQHRLPRPLLLHPAESSSGSSESTSGFASGRDRLRTGDGLSDGPRSPPQSPFRARFASDDGGRLTEQPRRRTESPKSPPPPPPPRMKAIRMDIDLNRPNSPPEQSQVSVRATVLRTAPPTAFTISFTDAPVKTTDSTTSPSALVSIDGVRELSLQEAARQAPTGRRLMARRSVPPGRAEAAATDSGSEAGGDPKRWLFRKMMMGREKGHGQGPAEVGADSLTEDQQESEQDKQDMASEAGTYVVESKMSQSQITTSTATGRRKQRVNLSGHSGSCSSASSSSSSSSATSKTASPPPPISGGAKRSLMSDLRRLREEKQSSSVVPQKVLPPRAPVPQRKGQQLQGPPRPCRQLSSANETRKADNSAFSRSDGGRFSMRPARGGGAVQQRKGQQGPQPAGQVRQSLGTPKAKVAQHPPQQSPEMVAWLRRKEYDPRKAAANNQQQQQQNQLKQKLLRLAPLALPEECSSSMTGDEQEMFMANRSLSTSATAAAPSSSFARWRQQQAADLRSSHRSHDDLSRLGESLDEESLMGSATAAGGGGEGALQRMVDELTQKCHKSIALLKLCNHSGLSSSVEQLLERVVDGGTGAEPPEREGHNNARHGGGENIPDRLERLSSAFDAIQKYLEEQTTMSNSRGSLAALTGTSMPSPEGSRKKE